MLYWSAVFFVIALVAAVFGFGGISSAAVDMAQLLFFAFLIAFVVTGLIGLVTGRKVRALRD